MSFVSAPISLFQSQLRGEITAQIAKQGHAPSNEWLAAHFACSTKEIEQALVRLQAAHALVLHPHKVEPWIVHPFALAPSSCWIEIGKQGWWASCLYCAFGIASAMKADADIHTRLGGEKEPLLLRIRNQELVDKDLVFHLSTPIAHWWDNVVHSCSCFQPFRKESEVEGWCTRHAIPTGAVVPMEQMWRFASDWYGGYLSQPWVKRSEEELQDLLQSYGLVGSFWSIKARRDRR